MKKSIQAIAVFIAVIACTTGFRASGTSTSEPRQIEIKAKMFAFEPNVITLKKGEPAEVVFKSADVEHGLHVEGIKLDLVIPKRGTRQVKFTPQETGDYVGNCAVFCGTGHGLMTLTIHVTD